MSTIRSEGRREGEKGKETGKVSANNWCPIHSPPCRKKKQNQKPKKCLKHELHCLFINWHNHSLLFTALPLVLLTQVSELGVVLACRQIL